MVIPLLITEVSSIEKSLYALQHYMGTQNGVLNLHTYAIWSFVMKRTSILYDFAQTNSNIYSVLF